MPEKRKLQSWEIEQQERVAREAKFGPLLKELGSRLAASPLMVLQHFEDRDRRYSNHGSQRVFDLRGLEQFIDDLFQVLRVPRVEVFNLVHAQLAPQPKEEPANARKSKAKPKKPAQKTTRRAERGSQRTKKAAAAPESSTPAKAESKPKTSPVDEQILDLAAARPIKIGDAIAKLKLKRSLVSSSIKRLVKSGKLKREGKEKNVRYLAALDTVTRPSAPASATTRGKSAAGEAPTAGGTLPLSEWLTDFGWTTAFTLDELHAKAQRERTEDATQVETELHRLVREGRLEAQGNGKTRCYYSPDLDAAPPKRSDGTAVQRKQQALFNGATTPANANP